MNLYFESINPLGGASLIEQGLWPSIWVSVATFLSLCIMFLIVSKFAYFPVKEILEKRQNKIKKELDEAAKMNTDSLETSAKIDEEYRKIKIEKNSIIDNSKIEAEKIGNEIIEVAKEEANKIIERGKENLNSETKLAWEKLRKDVSSLSIEIAEKIILEKIDKKTEEKLIEEFLKKLDNE